MALCDACAMNCISVAMNSGVAANSDATLLVLSSVNTWSTRNAMPCSTDTSSMDLANVVT